MSYDPQRFAMDYHNIGFRECVAEVARYLVTIEGMDLQDPLRMRLMSHLQCFLTQRELSAKSNSSPAWTPGSYQTTYPSHTPTTYYHQNYAPQTTTSAAYIPQVGTIPPNDPSQHYASPTDQASHYDNTAHQEQHQQQQHHQQQHQQGPTYLDLTNANRAMPASLGYGNPQYPVSTSTNGYSSTSGYNNNNNSSKPYRPWGAEMAC